MRVGRTGGQGFFGVLGAGDGVVGGLGGVGLVVGALVIPLSDNHYVV